MKRHSIPGSRRHTGTTCTRDRHRLHRACSPGRFRRRSTARCRYDKTRRVCCHLRSFLKTYRSVVKIDPGGAAKPHSTFRDLLSCGAEGLGIYFRSFTFSFSPLSLLSLWKVWNGNEATGQDKDRKRSERKGKAAKGNERKGRISNSIHSHPIYVHVVGGRGDEFGIYLQIANAQKEGRGFGTQSSCPPNPLSHGIYFYRPAGEVFAWTVPDPLGHPGFGRPPWKSVARGGPG